MNALRERIHWSQLDRFKPFCTNWGNSRGGAIDRLYIDRFVKQEIKEAEGGILECGGDRYRSCIKSKNLSGYDVVDIDKHLPSLTIHRDIQDLRGIKSSRFDVIVCTQVLQYVENPDKALGELRRVLKPGGRLLVTTPFVEKDCKKLSDRWRFTRKGMLDLLRSFTAFEVSVCGNLFVAACYWMCLGM